MSNTPPCPCQSGQAYAVCCEPYHLGEADAPTPETLMRSRYSAFALANVDYIERTMQGPAAESFDKADCLQFATSMTWLGLTILSTQTLSAVRGLVEFHARFTTTDGTPQSIHERSVFQKKEGKWYYVDRVKPLTPPASLQADISPQILP